MLPVNIAHRLVSALADNDTEVLNSVLLPNAYLQVRGNGRMQIYWTRTRVKAALWAEFSRWEAPAIAIGNITPHASAITVTFQVEGRRDGRLIKHDYFALLIPHFGQIQTMILYCYHETACAPEGVWSLAFPAEQIPLAQPITTPQSNAYA